MPLRYKSQGLPKIPSDFRQVAEELLGPVDWQNEDSGFCQCPGSHRHTAPSRERDCRVYLDAEDGYAPTIHCFHESCKDEVRDENEIDPKKNHKIDRHAVTEIKCLNCDKI